MHGLAELLGIHEEGLLDAPNLPVEVLFSVAIETVLLGGLGRLRMDRLGPPQQAKEQSQEKRGSGHPPARPHGFFRVESGHRAGG